MRRVLILVMVLLLPLRGWAGDLMAIGMATSPAMSSPAATMPDDCPMHAQAAMAAADADSGEAAVAMQGCGSCELCLPLAEVAAVDLDCAPHARHARPVFGEAGFLSAPAAPSLKPPIS